MGELELIKYLLLGALGVINWFMRKTINKLETDVIDLKREIVDIQIHYLQKEDFTLFRQEIRDMFAELRNDIKEIK
jgi:hypothetical protein